MDFDIGSFFSEIDRSLEASRQVFQQLDRVMMSLTEADWLRIEAKVIPLSCHHSHRNIILALGLSHRASYVSKLNKPSFENKTSMTKLQSFID